MCDRVVGRFSVVSFDLQFVNGQGTSRSLSHQNETKNPFVLNLWFFERLALFMRNFFFARRHSMMNDVN